jgi:hypothetical protein
MESRSIMTNTLPRYIRRLPGAVATPHPWRRWRSHQRLDDPLGRPQIWSAKSLSELVIDRLQELASLAPPTLMLP